jgi:hypothetical protein
MRRSAIGICLLFIFMFPAVWAGNLEIRPTTTLKAQTANNTSASANFASQSNGNVGAGNISKLDIHSLLYPGARTQIYAHLMLWFGSSKHMDIGYSSTDANQIKRQIQDMVSRGIDGVMLDWYGPGSASDQATQLIMKEAEHHSGFSVAIIIDKGAIKSSSCGECSPQQALVQQLQYIERNYFDSPAYMRQDGRPVVSNFDVDGSYTVDWQAAKKAMASQPIFIFQNSGGFTHVITNGSFSWVMPKSSDLGVSYLTNFYKTGQSHSSLKTFGAAYKGFNDKFAGWGSNRVMTQGCGQTWLQTFSTINHLYNSGNQLDAVQLATWNDYEEGTELESGIDNCVSVSAKVSGDELKWSISGQENTIDHYKIFISNNGQDLMPLTDMATGLSSLNLCSFSLGAGNYRLFVQAVGRPSMTNQISGSVSYSPKCAAGSVPLITLEAAPASLSIPTGHSAKATVKVSSQAGSLDVPVILACSDLPVGMTCDFAPSTVSSKSANADSTLSVSISPLAGISRHRQINPFYASLFTFGSLGLLGIGQIKRKQILRAGLVLAIACFVVLLIGCGSGARVQSGSSYKIKIIGTAGGSQVSTTMSVGVN